MNTAGRLLVIYDKLTGTGWPQDKTMVWVWSEVFGLPQDRAHPEDDVVSCLQAMRSEVDLLQVKLLSLGAPKDLMHPCLARLRNATSTVYLNTQWNGLREETSKPENRISLLWADWTLRDESEGDLQPEELHALRAELDSLEESLHNTAMTPYMQGFIQRQIDAIRAALRLYPIRGVKPLEEAARQVVGTCQLEAPVLVKEFEKASEPAKSVFAKAGEFIEKTAKVADNLDKIRKAGEGAYTLAASVAPVVLAWGQYLLK